MMIVASIAPYSIRSKLHTATECYGELSAGYGHYCEIHWLENWLCMLCGVHIYHCRDIAYNASGVWLSKVLYIFVFDKVFTSWCIWKRERVEVVEGKSKRRRREDEEKTKRVEETGRRNGWGPGAVPVMGVFSCPRNFHRHGECPIQYTCRHSPVYMYSMRRHTGSQLAETPGPVASVLNHCRLLPVFYFIWLVCDDISSLLRPWILRKSLCRHYCVL